MSKDAEIADRRERAREAFWDGAADESSLSNGHPFLRALGNCVEVATQVKLTPEIIEAAGAADVDSDGPELIARLVLKAAGFEVIG